MPINKVIYGKNTLIDLTNDTVTKTSLKKGFTAHNASGTIITGVNSDEIDRILISGLIDGMKSFSDDGKNISTTDSAGRILTKTFSSDFLTCTTILKGADGIEIARLVKTCSSDGKQIASSVTYR